MRNRYSLIFLQFACFSILASCLLWSNTAKAGPDSLTNIIADFTHSVNGMTASFMESSSSDSDITNFFWDFGDTNGGQHFLDTDKAVNPTYTYPANGNYSVLYSVYDGTCVGEVTKTVTIGGTSSSGRVSDNYSWAMELNAYPNPFQGQLNIQATVSDVSMVNLTVYNVGGQKFPILTTQRLMPGTHQLSWDAHGYPAGVYFVVLEQGERSLELKVLLQ